MQEESNIKDSNIADETLASKISKESTTENNSEVPVSPKKPTKQVS